MFDRKRHGLALLVALSIGSTFAGVASEAPGEAWLEEVSTALAEQEYDVTWQPRTHLADLEAAWQAPNRAHGFRTYFAESGPRVVPRIEGDSWEWGLSLVGCGRNGASWIVPPAVLRPGMNRIDYERGVLTEWYENSSRGLEQGFTLWVKPQETGLVHLDLRLVGTLEPALADDGRAVDFRTGDGVNALRYAELLVTDADGRELPAWIEGFSGEGSGGLRIVFDDEGAAYPVTVDPLTTSPSWTAESNQAVADFGWSVATAGDVNGDGYSDVIVGSPQYDSGESGEGRVWVYHGSASGLSASPAWTAEGNQLAAIFGYSVSTAGDVNGDGYSDVIIGAYGFDNGQTDEGRAFVYLGSASGLSAAASWTAENDQASSYFGYSVAAAGDVNGDGYADVIVGARFFDNPQSDEGRAYVYLGSASGLSSSEAWTAEGNQDGAWFGDPVAGAGDVNGDGYSDVIVGAWGFDNPQTDEGRAYVYHGSAAGLSTTAAWTKESDQTFAYFGVSVATAGDVNGDGYSDVIVGASGFEFGQVDEGRAFVYHGSASGLSTTASRTIESNQASASLGKSVASAGDVNGDGYADVIVGALYYNAGQPTEGKAWVYHGSASGVASAAAWSGESNQNGALFGESVACAGDVNGDGYSDVIVSAPRYDNPQLNEGRAYVYNGSPSGVSTLAAWSQESNQINARMGASVATAGDVNGDGYADVIVGVANYDNGENGEGRAYVYHGSSAGIGTSAAWSAEGNLIAAGFGHSVATAGDVNGDGYSDVIIGANWYSNGEDSEGRAFVYHGSASGLGTTQAWTAEGNQLDARFGESVATAGDVNGDGFSDVIVGSPQYDNPTSNEGRAWVYHGSASGLLATAAWTAESNQLGAMFGNSVGTAGDVNRDGYSDVIVGSALLDNPQTDEGRAYVYHGSAAGLSFSAAWTGEGNQDLSYYGQYVATAGDVNGDGYADVIVSAYGYNNGPGYQGRVWVYHGSASGLAFTAAWSAQSDRVDTCFGSAVATAGDVNGDGKSDVIVGDWCYDNGQTNEGAAILFHGSSAGLSTTRASVLESNMLDAALGQSAASAGDVNGDGYADVIVGAPNYDHPEDNEGRVFLYYGGGGRGVAMRPQQRRASDAAPIAPLGASDSGSSFRLASIGRTPFGRGRVKIELEVKPLDLPLSGSATSVSATWVDTGTLGAALNQLVSGLTPSKLYHWQFRLRYNQATTPFLQRSRWLTVPSNGKQEADLRTP